MNEEIEKLRACIQRLSERLALYEQWRKYDAAIRSGEELLQKHEQFKRSLPPPFPWPGKAGRPSKWRGRLGFELLEAVEAIRKDNGIGIATAIEALCKSSPIWGKYQRRTLEARYQEARKFWQPWIEQDRILDAELEKFRLISDQLNHSRDK
jgi:hypothetical protein